MLCRDAKNSIVEIRSVFNVSNCKINIIINSILLSYFVNNVSFLYCQYVFISLCKFLDSCPDDGTQTSSKTSINTYTQSTIYLCSVLTRLFWVETLFVQITYTINICKRVSCRNSMYENTNFLRAIKTKTGKSTYSYIYTLRFSLEKGIEK